MNLSDEHLENLQEMMNLLVGRSVDPLSMLFSKHIHLKTPTANLEHKNLTEEINRHLSIDASLFLVTINFEGDFNGALHFSMMEESWLYLLNEANILDNPVSFVDECHYETLQELIRPVLQTFLSQLLRLLEVKLTYPHVRFSPVDLDAVNSDNRDPLNHLSCSIFTGEKDFKGVLVLTMEEESFAKFSSSSNTYFDDLMGQLD